MYKKPALACFILCIAIILLLALSACGGPETTSTTGSSGDTEATGGDTTLTSAPSEATETTTALWQPNLAGEVWDFNPLFPHTDVDINDYDIEITIDETVYSEVPESISLKITNKTGKNIWLCIAAYIEKPYMVESSPGSGHDIPRAPVWVRLPYYIWPTWAELEVSETSWEIDLTKYWREPYEFTPGKYRITLFFPDGPHYAYFEITG